MSARKRGGVRPAHDWQLLPPLFEWPEQERYEQIRPLVLFGLTALPFANASCSSNLGRSPVGPGQASPTSEHC